MSTPSLFHFQVSQFCKQMMHCIEEPSCPEAEITEVEQLAQAILSSLSSQTLFPEEIDRLLRVKELWAGRDSTEPFALLQEVNRLFQAVLPSDKTVAATGAKRDPETTSSRRVSLLGNKTDNLARLKELFARTDGVSIPEFKGISHSEVLEYIQVKMPELDTLWEQFVEEGAEPGSPHLQTIRNRIMEIFASSTDFPPDDVLVPFLNKNKPLMVRSSGKEDSKEVPNPGGNESISNVAPNAADIRRAIGEVLASYFSEKSLTQRKCAGDSIDSLPLLPVLIQVMVGEREGSPIPVSGGLYTSEGELGTEGVMQINAAFGHAEGIVTGSAPSDTFYVDGNFVHGSVAEKPTRRIPDPRLHLRTCDNPSSKRFAPSLTYDQLQRLKEIGEKIELYYGYPMDVEWTFLPEDNVFYLLQARPISDRPPSHPSFIDPAKIKDFDSLTRVSVIGAAGGECRQLNKIHTIIADNAPQALEIYLRDASTPCSAVIVAKPTASNSHEAAFFRSMGIPLIVMKKEDFEEYRSKIDTTDLLLDVQSSVIGALPRGKNKEALTMEGLRRFLAPSSESAIQDSLSQEQITAFQADLHILYRGVDRERMQKSLSELPGWSALDKLLGGLESTADPKERAYILSLILTMVERRLLKDVPMSRKEELLSKIFYAAKHVWQTLNREDLPHSHKLFAMHWLRAALLGFPSEGTVAADSLMTLLGEKKERALIKLPDVELLSAEEGALHEKKQEYIDVFLRSRKFILDADLRAAWNEFVLSLNLAELKILSSVFATLGPFATPFFLNVQFQRSFETSQGMDAATASKHILQEMGSSALSPEVARAIEFVHQVKNKTEEFKKIADQFGRRDRFEDLDRRLAEEIMPVVKELCAKISSADGLSQVMLSEAFRHMVACFDDCIKGLTASTEYRDDAKEKAERFSHLLNKYLAFAREAMADTMLGKDPEFLCEACCLIAFLCSTLQILNSEVEHNAAQLLLGSSGFSVSYAALGSNVRMWDRAPPRSLEDLFTTLHQSLMAVSAYLETLNGLQMKNLPPEMRAVCREICSLHLRVENRPHPTIQSIEYCHPKIRVCFNAPLAFHSAQFVLEAKLDLEGSIASMDLESRFFASPNMTGLFNRAEFLSLYGIDTYYGGKMVPSINASFLRAKCDTASICWNIYPIAEPLDAYLDRGLRHLQNMIDFLQKPGTKLPFSREYDRLISEHPEAISVFVQEAELLHKENFSDLDQFIHNFMRSFSERYSQDIALQYITCGPEFYCKISPTDPFLQKVIDQLIEDDVLWARADNTILYKLIGFLLVVNPIQVEMLYGDQETFTAALPLFSLERLQKIKRRFPLIQAIAALPTTPRWDRRSYSEFMQQCALSEQRIQNETSTPPRLETPPPPLTDAPSTLSVDISTDKIGSHPLSLKIVGTYKGDGYLELRGEGSGLSWNSGVPIRVDPLGQFTIEGLNPGTQYKFVECKEGGIRWERGDNHLVDESTGLLSIEPHFSQDGDATAAPATLSMEYAGPGRLEIRGDGPSMSWYRGIPIDKDASGRYIFPLPSVPTKDFEFKYCCVLEDGTFIWQEGANNHFLISGINPVVQPRLL